MAAHLNEYYVRPTNGTDVAGGGTSHATAYQTMTFAISDITATHGLNLGSKPDRLNLSTEATHFPGSNMAVNPGTQGFTYGGYTSVAGDGGMPLIDLGTGGSARQFSARNYVNFVGLRITGGLNPIGLQEGVFCDCELFNTSSGGILANANAAIIGSEIHGISNFAISGTSTNTIIANNHFYQSNGKVFSTNAAKTGGGATFVNNIVDMGTSTANAFESTSTNSVVSNNSFYGTGASGNFIRTGSYSRIFNNIFSGGSGQTAISTSSGQPTAITYCTFHGVGTDSDVDAVVYHQNETLTFSPYIDAANGDFTPVSGGSMRTGGRGSWNKISRGGVQLSMSDLSTKLHPLSYN